jgi:hypothetical protein
MLKKKKSMEVKRKLGDGPAGLRSLPLNIDQRLVITPIKSYADKRQGLMAKKDSINNHSLETSAASSTLSYERRNNKDARV